MRSARLGTGIEISGTGAEFGTEGVSTFWGVVSIGTGMEMSVRSGVELDVCVEVFSSLGVVRFGTEIDIEVAGMGVSFAEPSGCSLERLNVGTGMESSDSSSLSSSTFVPASDMLIVLSAKQ